MMERARVVTYRDILMLPEELDTLTKTHRCATCRWWQLTSDDVRRFHANEVLVHDPATFEIAVPQPFPVALCTSPKLRENERPEVDGAACVDASQYAAKLLTGADFGCVNWEATS